MFFVLLFVFLFSFFSEAVAVISISMLGSLIDRDTFNYRGMSHEIMS